MRRTIRKKIKVEPEKGVMPEECLERSLPERDEFFGVYSREWLLFDATMLTREDFVDKWSKYAPYNRGWYVTHADWAMGCACAKAKDLINIYL